MAVNWLKNNNNFFEKLIVFQSNSDFVEKLIMMNIVWRYLRKFLIFMKNFKNR